MMNLTTSIILLLFCTAGYIGFSIADKRTQSSLFRMLTLLCGVLGMMAMFFTLFNAAMLAGLL
jgi:hypothetical protein